MFLLLEQAVQLLFGPYMFWVKPDVLRCKPLETKERQLDEGTWVDYGTLLKFKKRDRLFTFRGESNQAF